MMSSPTVPPFDRLRALALLGPAPTVRPPLDRDVAIELCGRKSRSPARVPAMLALMDWMSKAQPASACADTTAAMAMMMAPQQHVELDEDEVNPFRATMLRSVSERGAGSQTARR